VESRLCLAAATAEYLRGTLDHSQPRPNGPGASRHGLEQNALAPKPATESRTEQRSAERMKPQSDLRFKTFALLLLVVCLGPIGDLCMSKGMRAIGTAPSWAPSVLAHYVFRVVCSPLVWIGALAMIGYFLSYYAVLSWADFSYVQPATALTYGIVALLGKYLLGESITPLRWAGVVTICIGVLIIGYTPPRTTASLNTERHSTPESVDVL
jgi:hypothetical protein